MTMERDPRYLDFFKMLRVGVPLPQVQSKMMTAGIDPSILEYVPLWFGVLLSFQRNPFWCSFWFVFSSNPNAASDYDPAVHGAQEQDDSDASDYEEEDW